MATPKEAAKGEVDIAIGSKRLGSKVILINGVSKSYGAAALIDNFSYLLKRDDRIGIIGANGSGKTTLMNVIGCMDRPTTGSYFLEGEEISNIPADRLAELLTQPRRQLPFPV